MCGRFTLSTEVLAILDMFDLGGLFELADDRAPGPRFNIAPTQDVAAVRAWPTGERDLDFLHWGLIPFWAKDKTIGSRMINARSETLAEKPAFRNAYKKRRCLVPADGWYEWMKSDEPKGPKQPYHIRKPGLEPFAFAGLWEQWTDKGTGEHIESCTVITTGPSPDLAHIHDRMPVVLDREHWERWLDPGWQDTDGLQPLLTAAPEGMFEAVPVDRRVGNVRNDDPGCIEALG